MASEIVAQLKDLLKEFTKTPYQLLNGACSLSSKCKCIYCRTEQAIAEPASDCPTCADHLKRIAGLEAAIAEVMALRVDGHSGSASMRLIDAWNICNAAISGSTSALDAAIADAKRVGAAEELERLSDSWKETRGHDTLASYKLRKRAAELRKGATSEKPSTAA